MKKMEQYKQTTAGYTIGDLSGDDYDGGMGVYVYVVLWCGGYGVGCVWFVREYTVKWIIK